MRGEEIFYGPLAKGLPATPENIQDDSSLLWLVSSVGKRDTIRSEETLRKEGSGKTTEDSCFFIFLIRGEEIEAQQVMSGGPTEALSLYRGSFIDRAACSVDEKREALLYSGWVNLGAETTPAWLRDRVWELVPQRYLRGDLTE